MKNNRILKNKLKGVIDIVLVLGLISSILMLHFFDPLKAQVHHGAKAEDVFNWSTPHCILATILVGLMIVHIALHWKFIKALIPHKLYRKNKITTLTIVVFLCVAVSLIRYLFGITLPRMRFHSITVFAFIAVLALHLFNNRKKLLYLFKSH